MKTRVNKTEVMKRAWTIFKNNKSLFPTFSLALTRAWEVEKATVVYNAEMKDQEEYKKSFNADQSIDWEVNMRNENEKNVCLYGVDYANRQAQSWV